MTYSEIDTKILEIYKSYNIKSFPLDCEDIAMDLGCLLYKYSELSKKKLSICLMVSDESMKLHNRIYYNDNMIEGKIRFSIMHELGHIVHKFGLSYKAAQYAFNDYRKWYRRAVYRMSLNDKAMYTHFYNEDYGGFVHSITNCNICGEELYNTPEPHCNRCIKMFKPSTFRASNNRHEDNFYVAESNWLYGGL